MLAFVPLDVVDVALVEPALFPPFDVVLLPLPEELPDAPSDASPVASLEVLPDELPVDISSDEPFDLESPDFDSPDLVSPESVETPGEISEVSLLRLSSEVSFCSGETESSSQPDNTAIEMESQKTEVANTKHPFCRYLPIFPPFDIK